MNIIIFYEVGYNKYEMTTKHGTLHAEVDALLRLPYQNKPKKISLGVFTTNRQGSSLLMSKCCAKCERSIHLLCRKKGYILKKIYYIDEIGELQILWIKQAGKKAEAK